MFGLSSLQTLAAAIAISLLLGAGTGGTLAYKYRDARCVATIDAKALNQANARVHALEEQLATMKQALDDDAVTAAGNAGRMEELERTANDLRTKTSSGVCLPADDVNRLRSWWERGVAPGNPSGRGAK